VAAVKETTPSARGPVWDWALVRNRPVTRQAADVALGASPGPRPFLWTSPKPIKSEIRTAKSQALWRDQSDPSLRRVFDQQNFIPNFVVDQLFHDPSR